MKYSVLSLMVLFSFNMVGMVSVLDHTNLHVAARYGNAPALRNILRSGVSVNAQDEKGFTVLTRAVEGEKCENIQAVLAAGADVDGRNEDGSTALMVAIWHGMDPVRFLLVKGASVDLQDNDGMTALMHAVSCGSIDAMMALMDKGASMDLTDNKGRIAFDLCATRESRICLYNRNRCDQWAWDTDTCGR